MPLRRGPPQVRLSESILLDCWAGSSGFMPQDMSLRETPWKNFTFPQTLGCLSELLRTCFSLDRGDWQMGEVSLSLCLSWYLGERQHTTVTYLSSSLNAELSFWGPREVDSRGVLTKLADAVEIITFPSVPFPSFLSSPFFLPSFLLLSLPPFLSSTEFPVSPPGLELWLTLNLGSFCLSLPKC